MKIGWLVWVYEGDKYPHFRKYEPDFCWKKIQIVYAEVIEE
jgi:hypothetical protein